MTRSTPKMMSRSKSPERSYQALLKAVFSLLEEARKSSIRAVNSFMTVTYWEIGRRVVEFEQGGEERAAYGIGQLLRLSEDLSQRFGRGFSVDNLEICAASTSLTSRGEFPRQCLGNLM
jgi:hypothetical protein